MIRAVARFGRLLSLAGFVLWELTLATAQVAIEVVTPGTRMQPAVIAVPVHARTDVEVTILADLISLMPGTLVLEVPEDREVLFVHGLYVRSRRGFERRIGRLERRVLAVLR